jgi:hypothetical protein
MKRLLFLLLTSLLIIGCNKPPKIDNSNISKYKYYDRYAESIEIGLDDDNNAYITDLERNIQIILVCHIKKSYTNMDFAEQVYSEIHEYYANWDKSQMENYGKSRVDFCMDEAFKIKQEYDSVFKRNLKKYFVFYKEQSVYSLFNK